MVPIMGHMVTFRRSWKLQLQSGKQERTRTGVKRTKKYPRIVVFRVGVIIITYME